MIPNKNDFVKVYMQNFIDEGFVEAWGKKIVLRSIDGSTITVINNSETIIAYRILTDKKAKTVSTVHVDKEIDPKKYYREPMDRVLDLAELRKELAKEEQSRARQKLTEFKPSGAYDINYDNSAILRQSILQHPTKKN